MNIAQFNIGKLVAPTDDAAVAEFMEGLEPINALADESKGFVWRLQTDEGDATSIKLFDDDLIIVNYSVWETVEQLRDFVYRSRHREYLRRRLEWFEKHAEPHLVMWWVEEGEIPTVEAAVARLEHMQDHGPDEYAFTFSTVPEPA